MNVKLRGGAYWVAAELSETATQYIFRWGFSNGWRELKDEIKAMDGARWHPDEKYWSVKKSHRNAFQLLFLLGQDPYAPYETPLQIIHTTRPLWQHQKVGLSHSLQRKRSLIAGDMGVGKALIAIEFFERTPEDHWYICDRSGLEAFERECAKFGATVRPQMLTFDAAVQRVYNWSGGKAPRTLVVDEADLVKSPDSQRSKAMKHLTDSMREDWGDECYILLMGGTPAPNAPIDWWMQCEIACPGFLKDGNPFKFRDRYGVMVEMDAGTHKFKTLAQWKNGGPCKECIPVMPDPACSICLGEGTVPNEVEKLGARLDGLVLKIPKSEVLKHLPPKIYEQIRMHPSESTLRAAHMLIEQADNPLTALMRLRQLSDGFINKNGTLHRIDTPKVQAFRDQLELHDRVGRLVAFAPFHESIDRMEEIAVEAGWTVWKNDGRGSNMDFQTAYMSFQEGDGKILYLGHPQTGGRAVTLTRSPTVVFWSNDFKAGIRLQAEDRIHRPGMTSAKIVDLIHLPTDLFIVERLRDKHDMEKLTLRDVRSAL